MEKWKEFLGQGVLILAILVAWMANLVDSDTATKIIFAILALSNITVGTHEYKEYKLKSKGG